MDLVEDVAGLSWLGQFEHRPILKAQNLADRSLLDVQTTDSQILTDHPRGHRKPFRTEFVEPFDILDAYSAIRTPVLLVVVGVSDESVEAHLRFLDGVLGNAAIGDAYRDNARHFDARLGFAHRLAIHRTG